MHSRALLVYIKDHLRVESISLPRSDFSQSNTPQCSASCWLSLISLHPQTSIIGRPCHTVTYLLLNYVRLIRFTQSPELNYNTLPFLIHSIATSLFAFTLYKKPSVSKFIDAIKVVFIMTFLFCVSILTLVWYNQQTHPISGFVAVLIL